MATRRLSWRASSTRTRRSRSGCRTSTLSSVPSDAACPHDALGDLQRIPRVPHTHDFTEIFPPIVTTQCEAGRRCSNFGSSTTPSVTESSQLHVKSHPGARAGALQCRATARSRAGRSATLRSTSLEAELPFISFDDLSTISTT